MDADTPIGRYEPEQAFALAVRWLIEERIYTLNKFGVEADLGHTEDFNIHSPENETWWNQQFDTYIHRAGVLGLDNPAGIQALAKFTSTALGMLSAALQIYGPLPKPGVPSGEIQEWEV